jgi:GNAT superfamily N-acetyltransferase
MRHHIKHHIEPGRNGERAFREAQESGVVDHLRSLGRVGLGSRLRRLSERLMGDVARVYKAAGIDFNPTWFPLFSLIAMLPEGSGITVVEAAKQLKLTHGAVSQFAKEMTRAHLIQTRAHADDARRRTLHLAMQGRSLRMRLRPLWQSLDVAVKELLAEARVDLLGAVTRIEDALDRESSESRILGHLRGRRDESERALVITGYNARHRRDFERLNMEWITRHFWVEPDDQRVLGDPKRHIVDKGGEVLFALLDGKVVGTCALKKLGPTRFELAKMAVDESVRGRGIGARLLMATTEKARELGATELVLETHSSLESALRLYRNFGFEQIPLPKDVEHERTDTMMRLRLA